MAVCPAYDRLRRVAALFSRVRHPGPRYRVIPFCRLPSCVARRLPGPVGARIGVIDYLREENRVLREQLGGRRLRLDDNQAGD